MLMGRSAGTLRNIIFGKSDSPNCSTNWIILSRVASESDKLPSIIGPCRAALSPLFTKYSSWHFQFASPAVALLKFLPTATVQQLGDLTAMSVGPRMVSTSPQAKRSSSPPLTTSLFLFHKWWIQQMELFLPTNCHWNLRPSVSWSRLAAITTCHKIHTGDLIQIWTN